MLILTAVRQAQNTQIEAQRKGRGIEKKVSCVGTRSKAENFLNRCAVGLLAARLATHKTNSGVKFIV